MKVKFHLLVVVVGAALIVLAQAASRAKQCKYKKGDWSDCDPKTNSKTRTLTLKKDRTGGACVQTKTETRKCSTKCRYTKTAWGDCDSTTSSKSRTLTLQSGPSSCEQAKKETKPCKAKKCRYVKGQWSTCSADNKKTRTDTLELGSDSKCEASRTKTRKCGGGGGKGSTKCRYEKGQWSDCTATGTKTRTDTLKTGSPASCDATRTKVKKCRKATAGRKERCLYTRGPWTDCNTDGKKSRTDNLIPGSDSSCDPTRTRTKNCSESKKEKSTDCTKGQWSACVNGKKTLTLTKVAGGDKCEPTQTRQKPCRN